MAYLVRCVPCWIIEHRDRRGPVPLTSTGIDSYVTPGGHAVCLDHATIPDINGTHVAPIPHLTVDRPRPARTLR